LEAATTENAQALAPTACRYDAWKATCYAGTGGVREVDNLSRLASILPRLVPGQRRVAGVWNAAGLLGLSLVGAALVHVAFYHLPGGIQSSAYWTVALATLFVHCPLFGPLGVLAAIAVLAPLLGAGEILRLKRLEKALAWRLARQGAGIPYDIVPRSPWRLAGFVTALLILQTMLLGLAHLLCPMPVTMVMGGVSMTMPAAPVLSITPLHVAVAALLGALLWYTERRLTRLRTQIARCLRLLATPPRTAGPAPAIPGPARLPLAWSTQALFARPPPALA
jgi:hypothetical protein